MKRDASELYHRIEKYWLKELQLKKPSFARAVWKAENPAMVVIIVRVVKSLGNLESYISDKFIFLVSRIFFRKRNLFSNSGTSMEYGRGNNEFYFTFFYWITDRLVW